MAEKSSDTWKLSGMIGIRVNTIDDMVKNKSRHWSPGNLEKIMTVLEIEGITDLVAYKKDGDQ
jgi:putative transcriptional regulator